MAKELVEGGGESTPWSGCRLLRWPVNDPDVLDDIRAIQCHHLGSSQSVLYDACRGGHLEVVKWVVSKFHGGGDGMASWEIPMPFRVALRWGRMSVVKWLACSTGVVRACRKMARLRICGCDLGHFISSPNLEVLKFCTDLFCGDDMIPPANVCSTVLEHFTNETKLSPPSKCALKEGCEWIKKRFRLDPPDDQYFATAGGTKWAIKSFHLQPTLDDLNFVCADLADQQLVQWMMTKFGLGPVTYTTLLQACANRRVSVALLKFLVPRVTPSLTPEQLKDCLAYSLSGNNTSVADWLESTYHVMMDQQVRANHAQLTNEVLSNVCSLKCGDGIGGIQWLLSHCCSLIHIREDVVNEGVTYFLEQGYIRSAMLLLNTFDGLPVSCTMWNTNLSLSQVKELVSRGKFSVDQIAETVSARLDVRSGKVVKWLIQEFNLNREQVNIDNLVEDLINGNKSNCLEWLIRRFHLTLNEIARICSIDKIGRTNTSIGTWKMLLRVFPEMTAAFAMEHLRDFVTATPLHLEAAKKSLGITKAQATAAVDKRVLWSKLLWLGVG